MVNPYEPPSSRLAATSADGSLADGRYEFTERENAVIGRTAKLARIWGVIALVSGVLLLLMLLSGVGLTMAFAGEFDDAQVMVVIIVALVAALLPVSVVNLATGWYYVGAGRAFEDVVATTGQDVQLLMTGLARSTKAFQVEIIFIGVALALGIGMQVLAQVLQAMGQGG